MYLFKQGKLPSKRSIICVPKIITDILNVRLYVSYGRKLGGIALSEPFNEYA
jgi:hypothetical protein